MRNIIKINLVLALMAAVLFAGVNSALVDTPPAPAPAGSSFDQRLVQRKAERAEVLDYATQTRIINSCSITQGKIRSIENAMAPILTNRANTYRQIDSKLWVTIGQLRLANKDTFKLEEDRLKLVDKTTNFQTITTNFTQTMDDIQVINCKADPVGFKALIDTVRLYYSQLITQSGDSRDYVVNTIKPEMANQITGLQAKTPTDGGN